MTDKLKAKSMALATAGQVVSGRLSKRDIGRAMRATQETIAATLKEQVASRRLHAPYLDVLRKPFLDAGEKMASPSFLSARKGGPIRLKPLPPEVALGALSFTSATVVPPFDYRWTFWTNSGPALLVESSADPATGQLVANVSTNELRASSATAAAGVGIAFQP